jgi:hypothetical protein
LLLLIPVSKLRGFYTSALLLTPPDIYSDEIESRPLRSPVLFIPEGKITLSSSLLVIIKLELSPSDKTLEIVLVLKSLEVPFVPRVSMSSVVSGGLL